LSFSVSRQRSWQLSLRLWVLTFPLIPGAVLGDRKFIELEKEGTMTP
jgi:hypothetical protein